LSAAGRPHLHKARNDVETTGVDKTSIALRDTVADLLGT